MICHWQSLKRKANGEKERKILRERGTLMTGVTLTTEPVAANTSLALLYQLVILYGGAVRPVSLTYFHSPASFPPIPESQYLTRENLSFTSRSRYHRFPSSRLIDLPFAL